MTSQAYDFLTTADRKCQFFGTGMTALNQFQVWHKPKDITMVYIICVGGGGGGAGGFASAAATIASGGAGGGAGAISKYIFPAAFLPDTLYINVGQGGEGGNGQVQGGAAASGGSNGGTTYVRIRPDTSSSSVLAISGNTSARGATTAPVAGAGETIAAVANAILGQYGLIHNSTVWSVAGQAGTLAGGSGAVGVALSAIISGATNILNTGGTGGGGVNAGTTTAAGGAITGTAWLPTIPGGVAGGGAGTSAVYRNNSVYPLFGSGGTGGGGNTSAGTGGRGGLGYLGGGGGGGGGTNGAASVGGKGGDGGDGFVYIICS